MLRGLPFQSACALHPPGPPALLSSFEPSFRTKLLWLAGTVSFFANVPEHIAITQEEAASLSTQVATHFEHLLEEQDLGDMVVIIRIEYEIGCLITTLSLAAGAASAIAFTKNYPKIRKGLILLARDIHCFYVHLRAKKLSTWLYSDEVFKNAKSDGVSSIRSIAGEDLKEKPKPRPRSRNIARPKDTSRLRED